MEIDLNHFRVLDRGQLLVHELKHFYLNVDSTSMTKKSNGNTKGPRQSWDDYFYDMAELVATRSRDDCPVGAVVVGEDHVVISTGYNGLPRRVSDLEDRLEKKEKLRWTVHAETNATCNAARVGTSTKDCTIYVTKFPCSMCAGLLVQAGIRRLVTSDKSMWKNDPSGDNGKRSLRILMEAGVEIHAHNIDIGEIKTGPRAVATN